MVTSQVYCLKNIDGATRLIKACQSVQMHPPIQGRVGAHGTDLFAQQLFSMEPVKAGFFILVGATSSKNSQ